MADNTLDTIKLARAQEELRQEGEAFDQRKSHSNKWFLLQVAMGWVAVVMLPAVALCCSYIIAYNNQFNSATVTAASAALFVDVLGLIVSVWKIFLNPASNLKLEPVTKTTGSQGLERLGTQPISQISKPVSGG